MIRQDLENTKTISSLFDNFVINLDLATDLVEPVKNSQANCEAEDVSKDGATSKALDHNSESDGHPFEAGSLALVEFKAETRIAGDSTGANDNGRPLDGSMSDSDASANV